MFLRCFALFSFSFDKQLHNNAEKIKSHSKLTFELLMNAIKCGMEEKTNIILIVYINKIIIDLKKKKKQPFHHLTSPKKNTSFHRDE